VVRVAKAVNPAGATNEPRSPASTENNDRCRASPSG
jgi:hypothetical protein